MTLEQGRADRGIPAVTMPAASRADQPPDGWRLWWLAVRPRTLTLAVAPVLAGTVLAWAETSLFDPRPFLASLAGALAIQAGTNLHNDVADALRGGDQPLRQGPPRVTALGWASPARVERAAFVSFALAALIGLYLVWLGGWPILALGVASLLAGWGYSGGPRPVSHSPYGELLVIAFFGVGAVVGTYGLQAGAVSGTAVSLGVALGLVAAAVLMANNYRDMEADRLAGRRTLAILAGPRSSQALYALMVLLPLPLLASPQGPEGGWLALGGLFPALILTRRFVTWPRGPGFNLILASTARYQLLLALLVAVGLLWKAR